MDHKNHQSFFNDHILITVKCVRKWYRIICTKVKLIRKCEEDFLNQKYVAKDTAYIIILNIMYVTCI